jgi:hypothetical protein
MDKLKEMFERLPKWAKIGLPIIIVAGIAYYIYKNKGTSTASTSTEAATGDASTGGSDSSGGTPDSGDGGLPPTINIILPAVTPTPTPAVTTSPKHTPEKAQPKMIKLAAHWAAQDAKNAKAAGVKAPKAAIATKKMTEAQASAAVAHNKGVAVGLAAKKGKK